MMQPLAGIDPTILDYLDTDGLAKHVIKVLGIPASVVRGENEIAILREDRAAQQQQQQEMQQTMQMAQAAGQAAPAMDSVAEMGGPPQEMNPQQMDELAAIEAGEGV